MQEQYNLDTVDGCFKYLVEDSTNPDDIERVR